MNCTQEIMYKQTPDKHNILLKDIFTLYEKDMNYPNEVAAMDSNEVIGEQKKCD